MRGLARDCGLGLTTIRAALAALETKTLLRITRSPTPFAGKVEDRMNRYAVLERSENCHVADSEAQRSEIRHRTT